jgi:hypothetical protein
MAGAFLLMIHYHVWFDLKPQVSEAEGCADIERFLRSLVSSGDALGFQILRNKGAPLRSKLPRYHALVEFLDEAQFGEAMKAQEVRGVFAGLHGRVLDAVAGFHVEIFESISSAESESIPGLQACEI